MADTTRRPRDRMVFSAAQLFRRQGVTATGLREVVADADAPRGSLQHYFPGGKDELVSEALDWAGRYASGRVAAAMARARPPTPSGLFAAMAQQWVDEYDAHGFRSGCPVAAATVDCADTVESTRAAAARAFDRWRSALVTALGDLGVPGRRCRPIATLMLSALEGAIVLARAGRDTTPLHTVARELGPLLDAQAGERQRSADLTFAAGRPPRKRPGRGES